MSEPRAQVIGVGSPHGDDQFGWEVVFRLRAALPDDARAVAVNDPLAIVDVPASCELLMVVDACRGVGTVGSVHRFVWPDSRLALTPTTSSHAISLADALQLANTLGKLPTRVIVLVVEGESVEPAHGLSVAVAAAVPEVVARVLAEIATVIRLAVG